MAYGTFNNMVCCNHQFALASATGQCHWPAVAAGCTELVFRLEIHKQVMCLDAGSNAQLPYIHFFVQFADSNLEPDSLHSSNSQQ